MSQTPLLQDVMIKSIYISHTAGNYEHVDCGYVSTGTTLTLVMETDGTATAPGFSATYISYDATNSESATADKKGGFTTNKYSGTFLLWTPWGPGEVSCIER